MINQWSRVFKNSTLLSTHHIGLLYTWHRCVCVFHYVLFLLCKLLLNIKAFNTFNTAASLPSIAIKIRKTNSMFYSMSRNPCFSVMLVLLKIPWRLYFFLLLPLFKMIDQWYTTMLLHIKKQINDNPDLR